MCVCVRVCVCVYIYMYVCQSVWLAQCVKASAAPTHVRSCKQEVRVRHPVSGSDKLDSGFHPSVYVKCGAISM